MEKAAVYSNLKGLNQSTHAMYNISKNKEVMGEEQSANDKSNHTRNITKLYKRVNLWEESCINFYCGGNIVPSFSLNQLLSVKD